MSGAPCLRFAPPNGRQREPGAGSSRDVVARYLDPQLGRFVSRDPLGIWEDELGSGFTYASSNPFNRRDPWGLKDYYDDGLWGWGQAAWEVFVDTAPGLSPGNVVDSASQAVHTATLGYVDIRTKRAREVAHLGGPVVAHATGVSFIVGTVAGLAASILYAVETAVVMAEAPGLGATGTGAVPAAAGANQAGSMAGEATAEAVAAVGGAPPVVFPNQLPDQLVEELQLGRALGVQPLQICPENLDDLVELGEAAGGTLKWVLTTDGQLWAVPSHVGAQEIPHTIAAAGESVLAAGECQITGGAAAGEVLGISISNASGHYMPSNASLGQAVEAFLRAGVEFGEQIFSGR